jgi:hypothetical protein
MSEEKKITKTRRDGVAEIKEQRDLLFEALIVAVLMPSDQQKRAKAAALVLDLYPVARGFTPSDGITKCLKEFMHGKAVAS